METAAAPEAPAEGDREMEDAEGSVDVSIGGSPRTERAGSGSVLAPPAANGNGFLYEHVPAAPDAALETDVQDVVVSDASAGECC